MPVTAAKIAPNAVVVAVVIAIVVHVVTVRRPSVVAERLGVPVAALAVANNFAAIAPVDLVLTVAAINAAALAANVALVPISVAADPATVQNVANHSRCQKSTSHS